MQPGIVSSVVPIFAETPGSPDQVNNKSRMTVRSGPGYLEADFLDVRDTMRLAVFG